MAQTPSSVAKLRGRPVAAAATSTLSLPLVAISVAIASAASLAFEVLLTRLFSILFQYHFVFVATSLAICGLGLGGAIGAGLLANKRAAPLLQPGRLMLGLALALVFDCLVYTILPWAGAFWFQAILALPPFILVGLLLSSLFATRLNESARLYASDLLGAAVGSVLVLGLIAWVGAFTAILWLALLALIPAIALSLTTNDRPALRGGAIAAGAVALLLILSQALGILKFDLAAVQGAPPDKTMLRVLADPGLQGRITDTVWGPFARLDLVDVADPNYKLVFTDAGAGSYMMRFDGDLTKVANLKTDPEYLPFAMAPTTSTLILGSGAGKDVLLAELAGSKQVTAVELNPDMVALTRRYASYNGNILDLPGVTTVASDGRSFVEGSTEQYDLIYMNVVYSQAAGQEGTALAESYIFTQEAMQAYWRHLKPGGRIGIVTHNGFEGSRAMLTAIAAMEAEGLTLRQSLDRVILHQLASDDPETATGVLVVTRNFLDSDQLTAYNEQAQGVGMQMTYVPTLFEFAMKDLVKEIADIYTFSRNGDWNLTPTTDDQPFFYNLRWGLPEQVTLLVVLMVIVVGLYFFSTVVRYGQSGSRPTIYITLFFGLLGAAFMLVQLPLVQRFYLLLGNPTMALVVTLEGLLLGAGLGSLLSSRRQKDLVKLVTAAGAGIVLLVLALALLYPLIESSLLQTALPVRVAAILLMTVPLGMLIGVPFPTGLRIAGEWMPRSVPALWGFNAVATVLGAAIAAAGAMQFGFGAMMLLAAVLYALAIVLLNVSGIRTKVSGGARLP